MRPVPTSKPVDFTRPFRHVDAIATGALTRHHVVEDTYQPLFPGVSISAHVTVTMALRATGASLLAPDAVVGGLAAAALWDVDVAPPDPTVDLFVGRSRWRSVPGVRVHRAVVPQAETAVAGGVRVTSPARTALDLARWLPRGEAVVVVDALLRATGTDGAAARALAEGRAGERDVRRAAEALAWVDPRSPSPDASRLRVALLGRGMDVPSVAYRLLDGDGAPVADLALAWPAVRVGIAHTAGARAGAAAVGWEVLELREDAAGQWGTRRRAAPVDGVAAWVRRAGGPGRGVRRGSQ